MTHPTLRTCLLAFLCSFAAVAGVSAQTVILPEEAIYHCTLTRPPNPSELFDATLVVVDGDLGYLVYRYQAFFPGGGVNYYDATISTPTAIAGGWRFQFSYPFKGASVVCDLDVTQGGTHLRWHRCKVSGTPISDVVICDVAACS